MYTGDTLDGHSAGNPPDHEQRECGSPSGKHGGDREDRRGGDEQDFAAEAVGCGSGHQRAQQTAQQCATVGPTDLPRRSQLKELLIERFGAADDYEVVAEKQPAQRRYCRQ
jgi:hypothetical protein